MTRVIIVRDETPDVPASDVCTIVLLENKHVKIDPGGWTLSRAQDIDDGIADTDDMERFAAMPLYALPSLTEPLAFSLNSFGCMPDGGYVGEIVVDLDGPAGRVEREGSRTIAEEHIGQWNTYMRHEVWRVRVERVAVCDLGHEHPTILYEKGNFYSREEARTHGESWTQ